MCSPAVAYAPYSTMSTLPKAKPAPTISIPARPTRRARPSPLTGMADLALEDALILACTPTPKALETPSSTLLHTPIITHTTPSPSPLHLTFGPAAFAFPKPPRHASPSRSESSMPSLSPSGSSPKSPVTSDDDELPPTPINAPLSLSAVRPLSVRKSVVINDSDASDYDSEAEDEFDDGASWYAAELGPILSTPQSSSLRSNSKRDSFVLGPARPESYLPVANLGRGASIKRRSSIRVSRALLDNQKNLAVVEPAVNVLPGRRQSRRVAHSQLLPPRPSLFTASELLPVSQAPVTPVTPISPALSRVPRFPPRNPVPVDIFDDLVPSSLTIEAAIEEGSTPCTPFFPDTDEEADSAEWDDLSALDDVPFDLAQIAFAAPTPSGGFVLEALEEEVCDNETELGSNQSVVGLSITPATRTRASVPAPSTPPRASRVPSRPASPVKAIQQVQIQEERVLRSRWSTSTLGSIASPSTPSNSRTSKLRGFFSSARKSTQPTPSTPSGLPTLTPTKTSQKKLSSSSKESASPSRFAMFSPRAHQRRSMDSDVSAVSVATSSGSPTRALGRRDSRESLSSESSMKSLPQRKGIPMQLLARS